MHYVAVKNLDMCQNCGFCDEYVACSSKYVGYSEECVGCGACYISCPFEAIEMKEREIERKVKIEIDGKNFSLPEKITVKHALEILGYKVGKFPSKNDLFAPCEIGGCWSCALEVDGKAMPIHSIDYGFCNISEN